MGTGVDLLHKKITQNETVIFTWDHVIPWNNLHAVAYSTYGQPLYYLGYEIEGCTIHPDELRWLPVLQDGIISLIRNCFDMAKKNWR